MRIEALFAEALFEQSSLAKRLWDEFQEAGREFRANPRAFIAAAIRGDQLGGHRRRALIQLGLAISILVYGILFASILILWGVNARPPLAAKQTSGNPLIHIPVFPPQVPSLPESKERARGGGGGGGNNPLPATRGLPSPFSLDPMIIAPTTRPALKPPALPVIEHLLGHPSLNTVRDQIAPTGLPDGVEAPPSDGPGRNGGIGIGNNGGIGPGKGPGYRPGEDGGTGGGKYSPEGTGSGPEAARIVDTRPVLLNSPRPNYTEEARKNKVQGTVRARILVGADGAVKQVRIIPPGLPYGLNDEVIRAAYQMRFRPATRGGAPVAYWISLIIEFNLR